MVIFNWGRAMKKGLVMDLPIAVDKPKPSLAEKYCSRCRANHSVSAFAKHPNTRDGLQIWCTASTMEYRRERKRQKLQLKGLVPA